MFVLIGSFGFGLLIILRFSTQFFKQLHNIFVEFVLCLVISQPFFYQHLKHFEIYS